MVDRARYLEVSTVPSDNGQKVGIRPDKISRADLVALGHPQSPARSIRAKCVDCSGGDASEARKCVAVTCPLWAFRMGVNPFHARVKNG